MYSGGDSQGLPGRVSPFGDLRVKGHLHLTEAYRSLSRPSSPADAKASPVCPCLLPKSPSSRRKLPSGANTNSRFQALAVFSLKMLVSHKEYGSTGKEPPRARAGVLLDKREREEGRNRDLFEESGSDPGTSVMGDVWVSTPKEKTSKEAP